MSMLLLTNVPYKSSVLDTSSYLFVLLLGEFLSSTDDSSIVLVYCAVLGKMIAMENRH